MSISCFKQKHSINPGSPKSPTNEGIYKLYLTHDCCVVNTCSVMSPAGIKEAVPITVGEIKTKIKIWCFSGFLWWMLDVSPELE